MGASEILLIFFVYLMLFGAKGIPSLARTLGRAMNQFRQASNDIQREIMSSAEEVKRQANEIIEQPLEQKPAPKKESDTKPESDSTPITL